MLKVSYIIVLMLGSFLIWAALQDNYTILDHGSLGKIYADDILFLIIIIMFFSILFKFILDSLKGNSKRLLKFLLWCFMIFCFLYLTFYDDGTMSGTD
jgi:hypothetical protein